MSPSYRFMARKIDEIVHPIGLFGAALVVTHCSTCVTRCEKRQQFAPRLLAYGLIGFNLSEKLDNANRWLGNILGANAWGTSLIVGDGTTFPHCMQHQVANLAGSLNGSPPVLSGAAVEGPNSIAAKGTLSGMIACPTDGVDVFAQFNGKAVYKDFVQSFSTVEPAIDLTASSFLAFSWQIAGAPSGTP
jgi:hypothetical protein